MFTPYDLLVQGKIYESLIFVLNNYFLYFSFWLLLGVSIYAIIQSKTKNYNIAVLLMCIYFVVISPFATAGSAPLYYEITKYVQLLLIVIIGYSLYKLLVK